MRKLVAAFMGARAEAAPLAGGEAELEASLAAAFAAGRARWAALELDELAFVRHVAGVVSADETEPAAAVTRLHADDLYLACSCLREVPGAAAAFEAAHLRGLPSTLAGAVALAAPDADEVRQQLRVRLLVGEPSGQPPLLATYAGRGPLAAWVRTAAVRLALTGLRGARTGEEAARRAGAEAIPPAALRDPELDFLKEHYREEFSEAFQAALAALTARQRSVLRSYLVEGLTLERIGAAHGVDRSTVSRWISDARTTLAHETEQVLCERLGLTSGEFDSLARLVVSRAEVKLESSDDGTGPRRR